MTREDCICPTSGWNERRLNATGDRAEQPLAQRLSLSTRRFSNCLPGIDPDAGIAIKQIVRQAGHSRGLVRQVVRGHRTDVFRVQQSSLEAHLPWLDAQWDSGCRKGAELWRRMRERGFRGSMRVVSEWATRRCRAETACDHQLRKVPSARTIARLLTMARDHLSKAESVTVAAIEAGVAARTEARMLVELHWHDAAEWSLMLTGTAR